MRTLRVFRAAAPAQASAPVRAQSGLAGRLILDLQPLSDDAVEKSEHL